MFHCSKYYYLCYFISNHDTKNIYYLKMLKKLLPHQTKKVMVENPVFLSNKCTAIFGLMVIFGQVFFLFIQPNDMKIQPSGFGLPVWAFRPCLKKQVRQPYFFSQVKKLQSQKCTNYNLFLKRGLHFSKYFSPLYQTLELETTRGKQEGVGDRTTLLCDVTLEKHQYVFSKNCLLKNIE